MRKRSYCPNRTLSDSKLPFNIEITSGLKVYVRSGRFGQMIKADSIFLKRKQWIIVNHGGFVITIKGWDNKKSEFVYEISEVTE